MNTKLIIGIIVIIALGILALGYYWVMRRAANDTDGSATTTPQVVDETPGNDTVAAPVIRAEIAGTWRSVDDPKFVRVFTTNNTVIDRYDGDPDATTSGTWSTVTDPDDLPFEVNEGTTVLRVAFAEEVLFFGVTELTETELEMIYLGGNGVLRFTRE